MSARPIETPSLRLTPRSLRATTVAEPVAPPSTARLPAAAAPRRSRLWSRIAGNIPLLAALFDQGAVSCGNFITNVLLARSLPIEQYGIFALFLDAILFLNSIQAALLIYPLNVRCPLMDEDEVRRSSGTCLFLTLVMAIPLGLALAIYGVFIGAASVAIWAVLGQTCWQCQETLRRTLLARRNYARALVGDFISYLGQAVIIALFVAGHNADVPHAFIAMAVTSLAAAVVQGFQIGVMPAGFHAVVEMGRSFWVMGRWVMTANLANVITNVGCSYTLARSHGDAAMGRYAALSNLTRMANPLFITLATLIVPAVAVVSAKGLDSNTLASAWRAGRSYGFRGAALLLPFWGVLLFFPAHAITLLYPGRPQYLGLETDLRILVGISILTLINNVIAAIFNGIRRSRRPMAAQLIGAAVCIVVTIPLTIQFGLEGFLFGTLVATGAISVALMVQYHVLNRQTSELDDLPADANNLQGNPA